MELTRLEVAASQLEALPAEGEEADYIGRLDKVIRTLQGHRRQIIDELPGPVTGREYRIVEERSAKRSYNTRRLFDVFAREGHNIADLIDRDVVRVDWQWTKLRNLAIAEDIGLRIAGHELTDDEADHVGEVWRTPYKVEGVK